MKGRLPGFSIPWTQQCERCDRQCETSLATGIQTCSYGVNFIRAVPELLLFGFLLRDPSPSQAQSKAFKQNPKSFVRPELLQATLQILQGEKEALRYAKNHLLREYREQSMFKTELLELLRPEIKKNLAFLHDYKQFAARVKQNVNVLLEQQFPGQDIEVQLERAPKALAAIYWSAALMDDKLKMTFLLVQPERLADAERTQFRVHGLVLKHLRIYTAAFDAKGIRVIQTGHSIGEILAPQAFAAIPQTFLDNALKYSSRGCQVVVGFKEDAETIEFSVTSSGPKIEADELPKIFTLFFRGKEGVIQQEEGSGIGLYLAQFVAQNMGTQISVKQSPILSRCGYETTFSILLRRTR